MSEQADPGRSSAVRRATTIILPPVIKAVMKRDWHGQEHIPRDGGVIIAPNHLSYADWAAVALFTYQAGRYPFFLIKSSAFDVKLIGPFLRACGQLPVHRDRADAALVVRELKDAEASLRAGGCLIVYPEGTASRDPDLWPMVGKTGVARLALTTGAPVIPVAHWGAQVILPYGSTRPHLIPRHLVRMLAGPPVDLSAYRGRPLGREVLRVPPPRSWPTSPACSRSCAARSLRPCRSTPPPPAAPGRAGTARPGRRARRRSRPATTRPGRRHRRERGGHGRRHVGDDLRAGALRRGDAGRALGPPGGAGRGDQPAP
jgi:1-acyl-sn-glycerol-3-phosphate acyltransferase